MKYLKTYNKIVEGVGDRLSNDDPTLILINDLCLNISDIGFSVLVKGYESYSRGLINYDIIIGSSESSVVYDINNDNLEKLDNIDKTISKFNNLHLACKDLIERLVEGGLHLCEYHIDSGSKIYGFIRFVCKEDGSPVDPDYSYNVD